MDLLKILSNIKIPKTFREVITLFGGIGFLLILWVLKLQFQYIVINIGNLGKIEIDLLLILVAYLLGKLLLFVFNTVFNLLDISLELLFEQKRLTFKELWGRTQRYLAYKSLEIPHHEIYNQVNASEFWKTLDDLKLFEEAMEREVRSLILVKFFIIYSILFFCIITSLVQRFYTLLVSICLLAQWYNIKRRIFISELEIQKSIIKSQGNKISK